MIGIDPVHFWPVFLIALALLFGCSWVLVRHAALAAGAHSDGAPGMRHEYSPHYYAAFIRDWDGNRIEAVTFLKDAK